MKTITAVAVFCALAFAVVSASDAFAQSWGRRGADVRCKHGGTVNGKWYCNLKHAPPGSWNNYNSTGRYKNR